MSIDNNLLVYLVDDDEEDQLILKAALSELDDTILVQTFNNGKIMIEHFENAQSFKFPSLIVLDYNMPYLSGYDVLKFLKNNSLFKDIPVVMWSSSRRTEEITPCIELGAYDYIEKPITYASFTELATNLYCIVASAG